MRAIWGAVVAAVVVLGCSARVAPPSASTQAGTVALTADDKQLLVVDTDNALVAIIDTQTRAKIGEVKVGGLPERIVLAGDVAYVANRADRSVSVLRAEADGPHDGAARAWREETRLQVGVEPTALALSADGSRLYVVNATMLEDAETGSLMAFDTKAQQLLWELPVGLEPRGVALLEGDRALVSLSKSGDVVTVDLQKQTITQQGSGLYERANAGLLDQGQANGPMRVETAPLSQPAPDSVTFPEDEKFGGGSSLPGTFRPRVLTTLIPMPDGKKVIGTVTWSSEGMLGAPSGNVGGGGGSSYGGGPCRNGGVAAAGLATFVDDGSKVEAQVDDVSSCFGSSGEEPEFPLSILSPSFGGQPLQGPSAIATDPTGTWLFVVNRESDNVAVLPVSRKFREGAVGGTNVPVAVVAVGSGPNGIAVSSDGRKAYVYNAFDHSVSVLEGDSGSVREVGERIQIAGDVLPPDAVTGRRLFFSAIDARMSGPSIGIACASCHPDAREDGHVWNFPEGPRQTPALAGRKTTQTAPFHWNGEFAALSDFLDVTVRERMGGHGLSPTLVLQISAFLDVVPAPDNPHRKAELTPSQQRGQHAFTKASCDACHVGDTMTNNTFADVGTYVTIGPVQDDREGKLARGLNTPSLLGVARSAPFLHDGSAKTLKERILQGKAQDLHGSTSLLSDAEVDDLVDYLKAL